MATRCQVLVGGFGAPSQRDLDLGRHLVTYLEPLGWPEHVVVEDLSYSAHLVLHRIKELQPRKLVLVGAVATGSSTPGSVRRRTVPQEPADPRRAHDQLAASLAGPVDVDHTLSVLRQWGGLPPDTVVIEVEPADCSLGVGFSEDVAACFDDVLTMVREETHVDAPIEAPPAAPRLSPADGMSTLVEYADRRKRARQEDRHRGGVLLKRLPEDSGVEIATRSRPWGMGLNGGGDWYDVIGLPDGWVAAVIGDAPGRGMEAVGLKADLRVAVQAYTVLCGPSPGEIVMLLDRFVAATARGSETTVAVLALHPRTGELRLCSAGHCPPLVVDSAGSWFTHDTFTPSLGSGPVERTELRVTLEPSATVLLFTDGLLERHDQPLALGLLQMLEATTYRDGGLEALCDAVLTSCIDRRRREDDASLLALRLPAPAG
ncbi:MAG: PP2C family protein-serine/threonine phosphatase [Acidimicrobiia bacterium]